MSEHHEDHRIGGDDVISRLRDAGWTGAPEDVKALALECRRLRATLEDIDLIEGRTVLRVEVNLDQILQSLGASQCGALVITAPERLEDNPDFGQIVSGAVVHAVDVIVDSWRRSGMLEEVPHE